MLLSLATTLLLVCTDGNDSPAQLPLPLDQAAVETMVADSSPVAHEAPGELDSTYITNTTSYPIHLLLTVDKFNIETAESDIIDDEGNEPRRSVFLEEHEQKMGLSRLIPGWVIGGIGAAMIVAAIDNTDDLHTFIYKNSGILTIGGGLIVGGGALLTIGIPQLQKHKRWHSRYLLSTARSETSEP